MGTMTQRMVVGKADYAAIIRQLEGCSSMLFPMR